MAPKVFGRTLTIGAAEGKTLVLFGRAVDARAAAPWVIAGTALVVGGAWLQREARAFRRAWDEASADTVAAQ